MVHMMPIDSISLRDTLTCACSQSSEPLSNWFDWVSLIASLATLICFVVTCIQIYKVKKVNEQVRESVNDNNERIRQSITISTVSDALRLTEMVMSYIRKGHYELAALKLYELNNMAIEVANTYRELKKHQLRLVSEVEHLYDMANNGNSFYSPNYSISTIMQFNNVLKEIDTQIKQNIVKTDMS